MEKNLFLGVGQKIVIGLFCIGMMAAYAEESTLLVGSARVDTTPVDFPVKVNGSFVPHYSREVSDLLSARAIVIEEEETAIALCTVDACGMNDQLRNEAAAEVESQTGIPAANILIASTHCHSAPALTLVLGCDADEHYVEFVKPKIVEAIVTAAKNRQPARGGYAVGTDRDNVYCRRFLMKPGTADTLPEAFTGIKENRTMMNPGMNNPNIISRTSVPDPSVTVLAFETLDGKPLALLANYSLHYVGANGISSDYFGIFCEKIAQKLGADESFTAILTNGTSGDVNAIDFLNPDRKYDKESVAESVACAAEKAYRTIQFAPSLPVQAAQSILTLSIRKPSQEDRDEALAWIQSKGLTEPKDKESLYAFDTVALFDDCGTRDLQIQAFRVGKLAIGSAPCELYSFTGLDLKAQSPAGTSLIISMANGYFGYVPTVWSFNLGGYNTWRARSSCLEIEAEPKIRAEILRHWTNLFEK